MSPPPALPRIAYLTSEYPTVTHTFILREVAALRELGIEVDTFSIRSPPSSQLRGEDERHEAHRTTYILAAARRIWPLVAAQGLALRAPSRYFRTLFNAIALRGPGLRGLVYQLFYFGEATIIARDLTARGIVQLHSHFAMSAANAGLLAAELAGIPFSFTLHGPADLAEPDRWRLREKVAAAKWVACISEYARAQAMSHAAPEDHAKLHIVHCGVTPSEFDAAPKAESGAVRLAFVGRLAPVKGVDILIAAMELVRATHPDISLTIVGDGPDRATLEALAAPLGEIVHFTGYQSQAEVRGVLAESDIFVLPSHDEGVPVVLMEAMATRRPVIATRITGVPELVEDGVSGLLVPPGDVSALAEAILSLADDPDLRARMGASGRDAVERGFDIQCEAARIATLFVEADVPETRPKPLGPPAPA